MYNMYSEACTSFSFYNISPHNLNVDINRLADIGSEHCPNLIPIKSVTFGFVSKNLLHLPLRTCNN